MLPPDILRHAAELGLKIEPRGDNLAISPRGRLSPEFAATLKEHKTELLAWLTGSGIDIADDIRAAPVLPATKDITRHWPDGSPPAPAAGRGGTEAAWLHVAKQVLAGEFEGANASTRATLTIGLRNIPHPAARAALERLKRPL